MPRRTLPNKALQLTSHSKTQSARVLSGIALGRFGRAAEALWLAAERRPVGRRVQSVWMDLVMGGGDRDREFWEKHAANYDRSLKLFGRPFPRMLSLVSESVSGAANVLEVAAGTGLVTTAMAPRVGHLVATDYAEAMVGALRKRVGEAGLTNVECEQGDIYALAYPPGSFDAVVACNVLHLVPDLPKALQALCRVLSVGGKLIAPSFCHNETRTSRLVSRALAVIGQPMHRRFTTASLREVLEQAGVHVGLAETIPGLIPIGYVEGVLETRR